MKTLTKQLLRQKRVPVAWLIKIKLADSFYTLLNQHFKLVKLLLFRNESDRFTEHSGLYWYSQNNTQYRMLLNRGLQFHLLCWVSWCSTGYTTVAGCTNFTYIEQTCKDLQMTLASELWLKILYFIEYSAHFFTLKMMPNYSLHTIHGR